MNKAHCLMVPPIVFLNSKVLKHCLASTDKVSGVFIVPYWPLAVVWPCLVDKNQNFWEFVKYYRLFENFKPLISSGEYNN